MSSEYNPKSNVRFGSVNLSDYNAFAIYCNIFDRPERDVDVVSVPGRNGDLIFDNGRYKNLDRVYTIQVTGVANAQNLINALTATIGYQELEDDYDNTVYYMARLKNRPRVAQFVGNAVLLTVTFDRKPQRFLKSGRDTAITGTYIGRFQGWGTVSTIYVGVVKIVIENPYTETAYPKIFVPGDQPYYTWGFWARQLNENLTEPDATKLGRSVADDEATGNYRLLHIKKQMNGSDAQSGTTIDSEKKTVTHGTWFNPNDSDQFSNIYRFPALNPGMNYLYFIFHPFQTSGIMNIDYTKLVSPKVYGRWWTL